MPEKLANLQLFGLAHKQWLVPFSLPRGSAATRTPVSDCPVGVPSFISSPHRSRPVGPISALPAFPSSLPVTSE